MATRRSKRGRWGEKIAGDLNVMPLMNLFIVLIPMLLLSAVFVEITVIEMNQSSDDQQTPPPEEKPLSLAIHVSEGNYVVAGNGIRSRTISKSPSNDGGVISDATRSELAKALGEVRAAHPSNQSVQIVAQETTHYDELILLMDISRDAGLPQAALVGDANGAL